MEMLSPLPQCAWIHCPNKEAELKAHQGRMCEFCGLVKHCSKECRNLHFADSHGNLCIALVKVHKATVQNPLSDEDKSMLQRTVRYYCLCSQLQFACSSSHLPNNAPTHCV